MPDWSTQVPEHNAQLFAHRPAIIDYPIDGVTGETAAQSTIAFNYMWTPLVFDDHLAIVVM